MMCYSSLLVFFFFKQKTAYEMRISDWSSDVCSSDLFLCRDRRTARTDSRREHAAQSRTHSVDARVPWHGKLRGRPSRATGRDRQAVVRSEEHTSELQSLMRISYAVFCLKKKRYKYTYTTDSIEYD